MSKWRGMMAKKKFDPCQRFTGAREIRELGLARVGGDRAARSPQYRWIFQLMIGGDGDALQVSRLVRREGGTTILYPAQLIVPF